MTAISAMTILGSGPWSVPISCAIEGKAVERPQHMLDAGGCRYSWGKTLRLPLKPITCFPEKWFTHATPTLFNAGTPKPQLSSCFLLTMKDDSIDGIYDTLKKLC